MSKRWIVAIASLGTLGVAGVGAALVAGSSGSEPGGDPGVRRDGSVAATAVVDAPTRGDDELAMPPYLMAHSPDHLEGETAESTTPSPANTRTSAPATPITAPMPPTTTTTTVPAVSTTTTTPVPTPTLPGKKSDEPDGSPAASNDTYFIAADQIVAMYVLENDSDPDGDLSGATLALVSGPAHAQRFSLAGDYFRYRSYPSTSGQFSAEDSFVYELCDEAGNCDTATVSLFVEPG